ncbi:alpha/beta hydrolase [Steroidobacter flavus]|uniref:Alpha/beta hydrolase n=1 Tax=Steroidobacter flavus TaxID=1842136 RepID=A0ABV8T1E6_9GAMM
MNRSSSFACAWLAVAGFVVSLPVARAAHAQTPVTLPSTYGHTLRSKLNGAEYQLTVVLPAEYESSPSARYPTLYVMDGNRWAQLLAVLLPRFASRGAVPPIIVVGVDYQDARQRYQDYGPLSQRYYPMDPKRGAVNFMRVMKEEIISFVDANYRTDPKDRGIGGHSLGGLFAAYALLHESETFQRFWISSPSLFYEDEMLFKDFATFVKQRISRPLYVFMDVGGEELPAMQGTLERFAQQLSEAQRDKIIARTFVVPETNHMTVVPNVFAPALEHLYRYKPEITPAAVDLLRFAGDYQLPDGRVVTLITNGRELLYQDSTIDFQTSGALVRLLASAANTFFQRGDGMEIAFPEGDAIPQRLQLREAATQQWVEAVRLPPATPKRVAQPTNPGRP